jgi:hypothetical protein
VTPFLSDMEANSNSIGSNSYFILKQITFFVGSNDDRNKHLFRLKCMHFLEAMLIETNVTLEADTIANLYLKQ